MKLGMLREILRGCQQTATACCIGGSSNHGYTAVGWSSFGGSMLWRASSLLETVRKPMPPARQLYAPASVAERVIETLPASISMALLVRQSSFRRSTEALQLQECALLVPEPFVASCGADLTKPQTTFRCFPDMLQRRCASNLHSLSASLGSMETEQTCHVLCYPVCCKR